MLKLSNCNKTFYVNTDASKTAIAGVLLQEHNNQFLPVAYFSKSLKPSEQRYPPTKLELMVIYKSIIALKYNLYNRKFIVLSDSAPLKRSKKKTNNSEDLTTKWL